MACGQIALPSSVARIHSRQRLRNLQTRLVALERGGQVPLRHLHIAHPVVAHRQIALQRFPTRFCCLLRLAVQTQGAGGIPCGLHGIARFQQPPQAFGIHLQLAALKRLDQEARTGFPLQPGQRQRAA